MPSKPPTVLQVAQRRVGLRKAVKVCTFMVAYQVVRDDLGHSPTIEEYGDWWKQSRSTSYREQALFRQAFPSEETPDRLLDATAQAWASRPSRRPNPTALGDALAPSFAVV